MREFLKSFFLPSLFALPGLASYPLFAGYDEKRSIPNAGTEALPLAALLALLGAALLALRYWRRSRPRAWGAIAGLFAAPLLVGGALFLFVVLAPGVQLYAR